MKSDPSLYGAAQPSKPMQSVRTPTVVKYGAIIALALFFGFVAFYYFGPKSTTDPDIADRPVAGQKAQAPLAPASASAPEAR